jgi:hypothetical protein
VIPGATFHETQGDADVIGYGDVALPVTDDEWRAARLLARLHGLPLIVEANDPQDPRPPERAWWVGNINDPQGFGPTREAALAACVAEITVEAERLIRGNEESARTLRSHAEAHIRSAERTEAFARGLRTLLGRP